MASTNSRDRFAFALSNLKVGDWERFEHLASAFMAADFPELRTTASPSGDGGRDAELYATGDASVMVQFSIAGDWKAKIRQTAKRVNEKFDGVQVLLYVTNQVIGANGDDLKSELRREHRLFLDVRDQNWLLERQHNSRPAEEAAAALARVIVDPLLEQNRIIERRPAALSDLEQKAAIVHLELQWLNDERGKGLTKTAFEALVRSALRNTDAEHRMSRDEVRAAVRALLPEHDSDEVDRYADRALERLSTKRDGQVRPIKHKMPEDEFHTSYEEQKRLRAHLLEAEAREHELKVELAELVLQFGTDDAGIQPNSAEVEDVVACSRRVLEAFLLGRGEAFSAALRSGITAGLDFQSVRDLALKDVAKHAPTSMLPVVDVVEQVVREVLERPGMAIRRYLRGVLDAYTLLAFLQATPDVQGVVNKLISHGSVWLDTNIVLRLLAEQLLSEEERSYTKLLEAAGGGGLQLHVTDGVLEELERGIAKARNYVRLRGEWRGRVPFLYAAYATSGKSPAGFTYWLEEFVGSERPVDDLADYLEDTFGIKAESLRMELDQTEADLRGAVMESWIEAHEERRDENELDEILLRRLAEHDAENYLGVIARRGEGRDALGYSAWWLTLDSAAWRLGTRIRHRFEGPVPPSPVMSPDFLAGFLTFGPVRRQLKKDVKLSLPLALGHGMAEMFSPELVEEAERVRDQASDLPDRILRRRIRDSVERARRRRGELAAAGLGDIRQAEQGVSARLRP